jgi:hypothetical protein
MTIIIKEICNLTNLTPARSNIDGAESCFHPSYGLKINDNKICDPDPDIDSFLSIYAGKNWHERQKCE